MRARQPGRGVTLLPNGFSSPRAPFRVEVWAAMGLTLAYVAAPGATRVVGSVLSAALIADLANVGIGKLRET
jgi:hypothetical protein